MSTSHLRVLLITGSFPPMKCGVGDYTAFLAAALAKRGDVDVAVLTDEGAAAAKPDGVEVLPLARGWRVRDRAPLLDAVAKWKPDVAHVQYPTQGYGRRWLPWLLPVMLARRGVAIVQTWHEYLPYPLPRYVAPGLLRGGLVAVRPRFPEAMRWPSRSFLRRKEFRFIPNASTIPVVHLSDDERAAVRARYGAGDRRLIVYFGFVYPPKGVDLLFDVADPERDRVIIAADLHDDDPHHRMILERAAQADATVTGFLQPDDLSALIAAADAVVLPFRGGGGEWNTSIHAVVAQGTFLLTTSVTARGYDPTTNAYYAEPENVDELRTALAAHAGTRVQPRTEDPWRDIAAAHVELYRTVLGGARS